MGGLFPDSAKQKRKLSENESSLVPRPSDHVVWSDVKNE